MVISPKQRKETTADAVRKGCVEFAGSYPKSLARESQAGLDTSLSYACKKAEVGEKIIVAANASWHRIVDESLAQGETVSEADFEFLALDPKGVPEHVSVSFSKKSGWDISRKNLESELGVMDEEAKAAAKCSFISEAAALDVFGALVKEYSRKAPRLRLVHSGFSLCDEDFDVPTWRFKMSNWPIITYIKSREKNVAIETVIDAISGKVLRSQVGSG